MFTGPIIWWGIVYTVLMILGKLFTGLWLVRFTNKSSTPLSHFRQPSLPGWCCWVSGRSRASARRSVPRIRWAQSHGEAGTGTDLMAATGRQPQGIHPESRVDQSQEVPRNTHQNGTKIQNPSSLYPASIAGAAMVSRGEIGFLIASIAESKGIFANTSSGRPTAQGDSSEIYSIVI
jgi:hypothetical protein